MRLITPRKRRSSVVIATSDIAFLLLIFLVVTASLNYNPEITPPETEYTGVLDIEEDKILIEVTERGEISIAGEAVDLEKVANVLFSAGTDAVIEIFADRNSAFTDISNILKLLQDNQQYQVFFLLEQKNKNN